jgi:2-iminobutanoate/2-iminopropanoate deaminase
LIHQPRSRIAAIAVVFAAFVVSACTGLGDATIGGRPIIYKNAPGDEVEVKAGVVRKVESADENEVRRAEARAAQPAPRRDSASRVAQADTAPRGHAPTARVSDADFINRYTQASRYGDLLFVSGQIAVDPRTGAFDPSQDIEAQTRRVLDNIQAILEANRLTMANIVSTTVYISNISRISAMDAVYHGYFKGTPPARTVVEVSNLPRGAQVEISVVAGR